MHTHHSIYDEVLELDQQRDHDRHKDLKKAKLTLTECIIALIIALTCVSLHAVFLGTCPQKHNIDRSETVHDY
jgi:Ca2+:H+ antiporter